jgi:CBS-domain-containing membrane protein
MARKVYSCSPAATPEEAMRKMQEAQVRRLPVVDEAGELLGIVSLADLAREAKARPDTTALALLGETLANISQRRPAPASAPPTEQPRFDAPL